MLTLDIMLDMSTAILISNSLMAYPSYLKILGKDEFPNSNFLGAHMHHRYDLLQRPRFEQTARKSNLFISTKKCMWCFKSKIKYVLWHL